MLVVVLLWVCIVSVVCVCKLIAMSQVRLTHGDNDIILISLGCKGVSNAGNAQLATS